MAGRIRCVKPEILEDAKAARLSDCAWRLWVSIWLLADDHGRFRADAAMLAGAIFWGDTRPVGIVEEALEELRRAVLVILYTANGQEYGHVTHWGRHQRVDNAGKPRCPGPEEGILRRESPRVTANRGDLPPDHDHDLFVSSSFFLRKNSDSSTHHPAGVAEGVVGMEPASLAAGPAAPASPLPQITQLQGKGKGRGRPRKPKPSDPTAEEQAAIEAVIERLNARSGREYKPAGMHAQRILRLLRHGYSENDIRLVVWDRANHWACDPTMDSYLRPSTLFGPEKFDEYLAEAKTADKAQVKANGAERPAVDFRLLLGPGGKS